MLVDFCEALGRDAGALVLAEDHSRDNDWPDLEFWTRSLADSGHIISDVSVVCPTAPSHRHTGRRRLASVCGGTIRDKVPALRQSGY